jgi:hypothetical protein
MKRASILAAVIAGSLASHAEAATSFYTTTDLPPKYLATFNSDTPNSQVSLIGQAVGFPDGDRSTFLDLSPSGRLFAGCQVNNPTLYEFDAASGSVVDAMVIDEGHIEGLAVASSGLVYVKTETPLSIRAVDFDARIVSLVVALPGNIIDDIDFDADGTLIGYNQTGEMYRIPLDGSPPQLVATVSSLNAWSMTFSHADNAFYLLGDGTGSGGVDELWRLPWEKGQPAGDMEYVKDIYAAPCFGLAAIPEPSTVMLLGAAGLVVLRRRT